LFAPFTNIRFIIGIRNFNFIGLSGIFYRKRQKQEEGEIKKEPPE